jgi:signal transduction histidine kinase
LTYFEKYQLLNDSIYNQETQNQLSRLQTQYNVQQKENTILQQNNIITEKELLISKRNTFVAILASVLVVLLFSALYIGQKNKVKRKQAELAFQKKVQHERSRIARDLHDNMGAELTIINSSLDVKAYAMRDPKDKLEMETISDQVRKASALMRDTIWTVSEERISVARFGDKIREFASRTFQPKGITLHFKNASREIDLRPESTLNLFRIVQEVVNNASKHSGAKNFYIENFVNDSLIVLKDDGSGFDVDAAERGYGLNNMISRAADIKARVEFDSKPGEYTRVRIHVDKDSFWEL